MVRREVQRTVWPMDRAMKDSAEACRVRLGTAGAGVVIVSVSSIRRY